MCIFWLTSSTNLNGILGVFQLLPLQLYHLSMTSLNCRMFSAFDASHWDLKILLQPVPIESFSIYMDTIMFFAKSLFSLVFSFILVDM